MSSNKLQCQDYDATYIGQTGRLLKTRIKEHKNQINRKTSCESVITQHRLDHSHKFKWDNVKILDNKKTIEQKAHL